jgi:cell division protein ZipA
MNLRDWLIIIGVVIIIGIFIDGFRRMRLAKKDALKMSLDMGGDFENTPVDEGFNPELPGGGARIISSDVLDTGLVKVSENAHIITNDKLVANKNDDEGLVSSGKISADSESRIKSQITVETVNSSPVKSLKKPVAQVESNNKDSHALVVVINVHALTHQGFPGHEVKKLLEACGLDHGEMSIFHRHEQDDLLSPIQFSVANAIEPGYFDPDTLDEISTPGVSFFMTLPGPKDYSKAFEYMLETAQCFARNLKGELKDENLSVMKPQTIEHCRQRIKEFKRKELSKNRLSS